MIINTKKHKESKIKLYVVFKLKTKIRNKCKSK